MTIMPRTGDAALVAAGEVSEARQASGLIEKMKVETKADVELATQYIAEIKVKHDEVNAKRRSFVDPLKRVIDEIDDFFKPALMALTTAERVLKGKIETQVVSSLAQRDKLLGDVAKTSDQGERTQLVSQAAVLAPGKVEGMSIRESWGGVVVDAAAVMRWAIDNNRLELLGVNEKALLQLTKTLGKDPGIPGWKAEIKRSVAVTAGKVLR